MVKSCRLLLVGLESQQSSFKPTDLSCEGFQAESSVGPLLQQFGAMTLKQSVVKRAFGKGGSYHDLIMKTHLAKRSNLTAQFMRHWHPLGNQ